MTLELLKWKASNGWSDSSFSALLELLSKVLPKPNGLPTSTYLIKKIICPLTLGVEKIHAFLNHCILYRKEHEFKDKCPKCNTSQYKWNDNIEEDSYNNKRKDGRGTTPLLQIKTIKGLKREKFLPFWCGTYLSLTIWSICSLMLGKLNSCFGMSNKRGMERSDILLMVGSGNILTLVMRRNFSNDPSNIRFSVSTDGMNPFGEMRNPHST
jgi:hypothetical protein